MRRQKEKLLFEWIIFWNEMFDWIYCVQKEIKIFGISYEKMHMVNNEK